MKNRWISFGVILLALAVAGFVYFYLVLPQAPFSWDEAHHSIFSLMIARSVLQGDWQSFWHYTGIQIYWPFLHSWLSSIFLIVGGFSYSSARFTNVLTGFFSIILIYRTGLRLREKNSQAVGIITALLLVLSPMFLFFSATAMIENLGLLLFLILIRLQLMILDKQRKLLLIVTGIVLSLLYLTKYIYGIFFGVGLICFWISLLLFPQPGLGKKWVLRYFFWVLSGFLVIWGIWFFIPPAAIPAKFGVLLFRIGDTGGWNPHEFTRLENMLFYLRALLYTYTFSNGIYVLYLAGICFGLANWKNPKIRLLVLLFFANFIPMSLISNSQERFIYVCTPALFLLSAVFCVELWKRLNNARLVFILVGGLVILGDMHKLPRYIREVGTASIHAYAFRIDNKFNYSTFFGLWSYPKFMRFTRKHFNHTAPRVESDINTENILNYILSNTEPNLPVCVPFYIGSLSPHLWHWHSIVHNRPIYTRWRPDSHYYVSLEVEDDSPYFLLWNSYMITGRNKKWIEFLSDLESQGAMRSIDSKYFPDLGIRVEIYTKNIPITDPLWRTTDF